MKRIYLALILLILSFSSGFAKPECTTDCSACDEKKGAIAQNTKETKASEDEFEAFNPATDASVSVQKLDSSKIVKASADNAGSGITNHYLFVPAIGVLASILAGFLVKFKKTRFLKPVFLAGALIFFGFYNGGCPCPVSSFQSVFLLPIGGEVSWLATLWFLALIPVTFFLGKTWCGWVCHLGGFQEFLYRNNRFQSLKSKKSQKIMKIMRYVLTIALLVQLLYTRENLFCVIDPFKAAFNLSSSHTIAWVLLALLIVSSIFINRPFCRAACPIGLALGLVHKIPFAKKVRINQDCSACKIGENTCGIQAIERKDGKSVIDNYECMSCGDCFDSCVEKCKINNNRFDKGFIE